VNDTFQWAIWSVAMAVVAGDALEIRFTAARILTVRRLVAAL
jgi:hypothetical protein